MIYLTRLYQEYSALEYKKGRSTTYAKTVFGFLLGVEKSTIDRYLGGKTRSVPVEIACYLASQLAQKEGRAIAEVLEEASQACQS